MDTAVGPQMAHASQLKLRLAHSMLEQVACLCSQRSKALGHAQVVVVTDGLLANTILGRGLSLDKALEPDLSDKLLSTCGHRTMFSAGEASPEVVIVYVWHLECLQLEIVLE